MNHNSNLLSKFGRLGLTVVASVVAVVRNLEQYMQDQDSPKKDFFGSLRDMHNDFSALDYLQVGEELKFRKHSILRSGFRHAAVIVIFILGMTSMRGESQQAQKFGKKELKALIANAQTYQDHEKIADYYRAKGERLKAKQREHEEELAEYFKNPSRFPYVKWPPMDQHCRNLAYYYGKQSEKAFALAEKHDQLAKEAQQK